MLNIEGPSGESLFRRPLSWFLSPDWQTKFQREVDEYWKHYADLVDDRAIVLAGALCVEDSLDEMIRAFFSEPRGLFENRDFSFALKIDIVRACKLIPRRILNDCDLIRNVRNDFAHELRLKNLSDWGDKNFQRWDQAIKEYDASYNFNVSHRERFKWLVGLIGIALKVYTTHVQGMRAFLDSDDFIKSLRQFKEKEHKT
jgi:hypothetical protein